MNENRTANGAIASMVCGIVGIILSWIPIIPIILGIIAIVLSTKARNSIIQTNNLSGEGLAITGLILGILQIVINVLIIILCIFASTNTSLQPFIYPTRF